MANDGRKIRGVDTFLLAVASGKSSREAADAANISERTATRWLADPALRRRVAKLRAEMFERAAGLVVDAMADAAAGLKDLAKNENPWIKLAACRGLLELGPRLLETTDLQERIAALETAEQKRQEKTNGQHPATGGRIGANGNGRG